MSTEMGSHRETSLIAGPPPRGSSGDEHRLRGNMGTAGVILTVMAYAAPLAAVSGYLSLVIGFGNGLGAPVTMLAAAAIILVFSIGYMGMTQRLPRPGAFYTYVTAGLGRPAGLAVAFLALWVYSIVIIALYTLVGLSGNQLLTSLMGEHSMPWWLWTFVALALVLAITYSNIEFSARTFIAIMTFEIVLVSIFDIVVFFDGGPEGHSLEPFTAGAFTTGSVGLAVMFAIGVFSGFEATAIYRDEVRTPEKTIPRATYGAVALLGVFYAIAVYALIVAHGASTVVEKSADSPDTLFSSVTFEYLGTFGRDILDVFILTSFFGACLAGQNIAVRYVQSLSADGAFVMPSKLAAVHRKHGSPYKAAIFVAGVYGATLAGAALAGFGPTDIYVWASGFGFYSLIVMVAITNVAIFVYFWARRHDVPKHLLFFPGVSVVLLWSLVYLATAHFSDITAGGTLLTVIGLAVTWGLLLLGIGVALGLRGARPDTYLRIGRRDVS